MKLEQDDFVGSAYENMFCDRILGALLPELEQKLWTSTLVWMPE